LEEFPELPEHKAFLQCPQSSMFHGLTKRKQEVRPAAKALNVEEGEESDLFYTKYFRYHYFYYFID
jgi:hypothetical protein